MVRRPGGAVVMTAMVAAVLMSGCATGTDPETTSAEPSPTPAAGADPEFGDVDGTWCPVPESGLTACVAVSLPSVAWDGSPADEYVYPRDTPAEDGDPREFTDAAYDHAPN